MMIYDLRFTIYDFCVIQDPVMDCALSIIKADYIRNSAFANLK